MPQSTQSLFPQNSNTQSQIPHNQNPESQFPQHQNTQGHFPPNQPQNNVLPQQFLQSPYLSLYQPHPPQYISQPNQYFPQQNFPGEDQQKQPSQQTQLLGFKYNIPVSNHFSTLENFNQENF